MRKWLFCISFLFLSTGFCEENFCKARIDAGPAYVHVDMLESGKTRRSLDLYAARVDATVLLFQAVAIKPSLMLADGKANLNTGAIGVGFCYPITENLVISPSVGYTETHFKSRINFPNYFLFHLREKFRSQGYYGALELAWTFMPTWRLYFSYQYAWSYVKTTIRPLATTKNHTQGPYYAATLEKDITKNWSISLSGGYNISLSKEKHGLRGAGAKLGVVYWF